ncbi:MAG: DUF4249 domain-containing protein [Bacteroidales bacterium]|jgi:hypothetical protein|nr:DUF4249 domain-containing protein [Bacteroidales bacterium]
MDFKYSTCCFLTVFLLCSCRDPVRDNFPGIDPVPVVYSMLKEGERLEVRLSWTAGLDTCRLKFIEDARIRLSVNGEYTETLTHSPKGLYSAICTVAPSTRYRCEISIPGRETVIVSDSIPALPDLIDVKHIPIAGRDEEGFTYPAVRFTFVNKPGEKRYFEAVIWEIRKDCEFVKNPETGEITSDCTYRSCAVQPGVVTDPVLQGEGLPVNVFGNELITGNVYTMTVNYTNGIQSRTDQGDWVTDSFPTVLELRSVSYDYYRYVKSKYLYQKGFEPEFGKQSSAFSLYSNIDGGYGIFSGYSASFSDTLNINR